MKIFEYGEKEISYLRSKDKRLAEVIDQVGLIQREVDADLFSSVVHHIIGQQISTRHRQQSGSGCERRWVRLMRKRYFLRTFPGCSLWDDVRKAEYISDFARKFTMAQLIWMQCGRCPMRMPSGN